MRSPLPQADTKTRMLRVLALACSAAAAIFATALLFEAARQDGADFWDYARSVLIFVTTAWLAWGASLALIGLPPAGRKHKIAELTGEQPATAVLVPICNEDPVDTFARIAAMDASMRADGLSCDIAILSDTRSEDGRRAEREAFKRLLVETEGAGHIFYRCRENNAGRKAGNVEDFFRRSGGAYTYAVILDADSLMEGRTIRRMIVEMEADPQLGLLQTLPKVTGARSFFGRAMQFASGFHGPVFTRGLARMQGQTGPFWGHNAIVRVRAFAESCALPELQGKPPFGGHILSHDYVEAALLARAGWAVRVDGSIEGSYEEGPENILSYAKRDRRWCQGNLQHIRLLTAPGLRGWSRFVFVQGIFSYLVSLLWAAFLIASVAATVMAPAPDYFPDPYQLFPVFPSDRTKQITALALGIVGLLIMPKFAILVESAATGRVRGFGGVMRALGSVVTEVLLTSLIAPLMLMYQTRAVLQVLAGRDGGWPANARGEGQLTLADAFSAAWWVMLTGVVALGLTFWLSPDLAPWLLPVTVPMILGPVLIAWSSRRLTYGLFRVPEEKQTPPVVASYREIHSRWAPRDSGNDSENLADAPAVA